MPQFAPFKATLPSGSTKANPIITPYLPDTPGYDGLALIVFPGGGYNIHAEHEGKGYADFFAGEGIASFVVEYRLGRQGARHPEMIEDAFAAITTIRNRAKEFAINPQKIGVIGSSAGGHLAAHACVAWREYEEPVALRPDFGILCYPAIQLKGPYASKGCARNLLGENPSEEALASVSIMERIDAETPPCFLWHTQADHAVSVQHSLGLASQLQKNQVPFELHVYTRGGHGLGRNTALAWDDDCLRWLREFTDGRMHRSATSG